MADFGINILFKPLQDSLITNWEVILTPILEKYVIDLRNEVVNFPQAALLLQNSTQFYCKRLDILYKLVENFVVFLQNNKENEEAEGVDKTKKRKKKAKNLVSNDLEVLDFVVTKHKIVLNRDKFEKVQRTKCQNSFLNALLKIPIKPNTANILYQANGAEMGRKDEFRLNWYVYSDGTLNEEFEFESLGKAVCVSAEDCPEPSYLMDDGHDYDMEIDQMPASPAENPEPTLLEPNPTLLEPNPSLRVITPEPPNISSHIEAQTKTQSKKPTKEIIWNEIGSKLVKQQKIRTKNVIIFPKDLIEEDGPRRKRIEKKVNSNSHIAFLFEVPLKSQATFQTDDLLIKIHKKERMALLSKKRFMKIRETQPLQYNEPEGIAPPPLVEDDHDDDHFDQEDHFNHDDSDDEFIAPFTQQHEQFEQMIEQGYQKATNDIMNKFKDIKKQLAADAYATSNRVAQWHESIKPALAASEGRSQFNVHDYGTKILNLFPEDDTTNYRTFDSVVRGKPKEEISRYLLSTLLLANTYSLDIRNSDSDELATDCLEMRLITKTRHHEELDANMQTASSGQQNTDDSIAMSSSTSKGQKRKKKK